MMPTGAPREQEGFALLETVIAFAILAIALAIGVETISRNARTFVRASDLETASLILHGLTAGEIDRLDEEGVTTGELDGAFWHISAASVPDDKIQPLVAVTVTIWPRGEEGPQYTYRTFTDLNGQ